MPRQNVQHTEVEAFRGKLESYSRRQSNTSELESQRKRKVTQRFNEVQRDQMRYTENWCDSLTYTKRRKNVFPPQMSALPFNHDLYYAHSRSASIDFSLNADDVAQSIESDFDMPSGNSTQGTNTPWDMRTPEPSSMDRSQKTLTSNPGMDGFFAGSIPSDDEELSAMLAQNQGGPIDTEMDEVEWFCSGVLSPNMAGVQY